MRRASEFRTFISRVDREFGATGYATVTKALTLTINAVCSLIATGILSPNNAVRARHPGSLSNLILEWEYSAVLC